MLYRLLCKLAAACAAAAVFAACASAPSVPASSAEAFGLLPDGAVVYGFVDIDRGKALVETIYPKFFDDKRAADFIKRTNSAVFGIYRVKNEQESRNEMNFYAITLGNYPLISYNLGFALSSKWKIVNFNGEQWWENENTALKLQKSTAKLRLGSGFPLNNDETDEFLPVITDALFSVSLVQAEALNALKNFGIPFELPVRALSFFIKDNADGGDLRPYLPSIKIEMRTASEAKALQAIFSIARTAFSQNKLLNSASSIFADIFFEKPPAADGNSITITGAAIDDIELSMLFDVFLRNFSAQKN